MRQTHCITLKKKTHRLLRLYASACMEHTACIRRFLTGEGKGCRDLYSSQPTNNVWTHIKIKPPFVTNLHFEFFLAPWWHVLYLAVQITSTAAALIILDPAA